VIAHEPWSQLRNDVTAGTVLERYGPSDAVSFEFLNVQSFVIGLASRPHCKQDLAPFLSQTPENRLVDMVPAATIPIVSPGPFGVGEAGETPVPKRAA
jgi:hypothetical protein